MLKLTNVKARIIMKPKIYSILIYQNFGLLLNAQMIRKKQIFLNVLILIKKDEINN